MKKVMMILALALAPLSAKALSEPDQATLTGLGTGAAASFGVSYLTLGVANVFAKTPAQATKAATVANLLLFSGYVTLLQANREFIGPRAVGAIGGWFLACSLRF